MLSLHHNQSLFFLHNHNQINIVKGKPENTQRIN